LAADVAPWPHPDDVCLVAVRVGEHAAERSSSLDAVTNAEQ